LGASRPKQDMKITEAVRLVSVVSSASRWLGCYFSVNLWLLSNKTSYLSTNIIKRSTFAIFEGTFKYDKYRYTRIQIHKSASHDAHFLFVCSKGSQPIGTIHRFSRLVTLLFHKWLHVRLNHKDACILTLT
jgi:hypothetical protein